MTPAERKRRQRARRTPQQREAARVRRNAQRRSRTAERQAVARQAYGNFAREWGSVAAIRKRRTLAALARLRDAGGSTPMTVEDFEGAGGWNALADFVEDGTITALIGAAGTTRLAPATVRAAGGGAGNGSDRSNGATGEGAAPDCPAPARDGGGRREPPPDAIPWKRPDPRSPPMSAAARWAMEAIRKPSG